MLRTAFLALGLPVVVVAVGLLALGDRPARWLVLEDPRQTVDALVVLAGDPDYERTRTAARMVLAGEARLLVVTGGEPGPGDHATSLRDVALSLGVPIEKIRMEKTSRSTREALLAVLPLLEREGIRRVALVTSPYHQRRAFLTARRAWPEVEIRNCPARPSSWSPEGWLWDPRGRSIVASEYAKLAWYRLRGWL
jgi:uncharacterized SAM-binding protein YcdF (DUF218 family)